VVFSLARGLLSIKALATDEPSKKIPGTKEHDNDGEDESEESDPADDSCGSDGRYLRGSKRSADDSRRRRADFHLPSGRSEVRFPASPHLVDWALDD
jgi:hypothetical protein